MKDLDKEFKVLDTHRGKTTFGSGEGYEQSGDSARERAATAAERREEIKEIYEE